MSTKKPFDPKEIMDTIEVPDNLSQLILESVEKGYERMQRKQRMKKVYLVKRAAIVTGIIAAGCLAAIPVKALVSSFVQERMEQTPEEELNKVESGLDTQTAEANSYSRELTAEEKKRYGEQFMAYNQGVFPEKELRQEKSADESLKDTLYYIQGESIYSLPQRNLTDEELLQIIDFEYKRDYVLEQKNAQENKERREQNQEKIAAAGGITEEEAVELGREWLSKLYGLTGEGMELNHYAETDGGDMLTYNVNFSIRSTEYYYFTLDGRNGELLHSIKSAAVDMDAERVAVAMLEEKKDELCRMAKDFLVNRLGKEEDFKQVVYSYREKDGRLDNIGNHVFFYFIKEDGSAYEMTMNVAGDTFSNFLVIDDYQEYTGSDKTERAGKMVYIEMEQSN